MSGFFQEHDKDGKKVFSMKRLLVFLAFVICLGGAITSGVLGITHMTMIGVWVAVALLVFALIFILVLMGYATAQDLKEIAKAIQGKEGE